MRAEGLFCSLDVLHGGLGIGKFTRLQFLIKKYLIFSAVNFFKILVIKAMDPDTDRYSASNAGSGSGSNEYGYKTMF